MPVSDTVAVLLFHTDGSVEYDGFHLSFSFFPLGKPVYFSLLDDFTWSVISVHNQFNSLSTFCLNLQPEFNKRQID